MRVLICVKVYDEEHCTCINGEVQCESCGCGADQVCEVRDGEPGCYYADGYSYMSMMNVSMIRHQSYMSTLSRVCS